MQGRSKRDSSAAAEQEPRGGTERGSSAQHTQNRTAGPSGESDRVARPGAAADPAAAAPRPTPDSGSRIALRNWRISTRLVSLLALPVVAATTLGALRIDDSVNDIRQLDHMQLLTEMTKEATTLAAQLQAERDQEAGPLSHGVPADDLSIKQLRTQTDRASKSFLEATNSIGNTDSGDDTLNSIRANVNQIATQVQQISDLRESSYQTPGASSLTVDSYDQLVTSLLSLSQDMAQATNNPDMIKRTRALAAFSSAKEYASIQRAIIAAALPEDPKKHRGKLSNSDRLYGNAAATKERNELTTFRSLYESMGGNAEELMAPLEGEGSPEIQAADDYENRVLGSSDGLANQPNRSYEDWIDQASVRINTMKTIESTLLGQMETKATQLRTQSQRDAIINGALILLVLGVSLVGAFIVARSMIRSLRRLQDTATKVAQDRLPELVKELSESDPQDVDTSVESVGVHSRDEIGQVAAAFDHVHREAVRLAAEQALLRGNVNAMFTNLSRRSQGLIQRQLSLISELESREADPDQLSSLFKLDHLATRMRRNGENLLVLAGEEPGRRWTRPVPLVDVLRAAASEVEQYERIELAAVPATEVAGRVVNDLVHLLAELLENATSFSSPQTKVRVTGHALPDGRVLVEIHDTGIGLSPEDLAAINERLASPPTVDVSVSRRMGLFVVGRLSLRHGIRIQLRPSDSGGTTALVMLPVDVAHGGKKAPGKPGAAAGQGRPAQNAPAARLTSGPGGAPAAGAKPGLGAGPGGGLAGLGTGGNRLGSGTGTGAGAPRGQVGAGAAPRAALPARDTSQPGRPNGAARGGSPQDSGAQDRGAGSASLFAQNAFGAGQGPAGPGTQDRPGQDAGADQGPATAQMPAIGGGPGRPEPAGYDRGGFDRGAGGPGPNVPGPGGPSGRDRQGGPAFQGGQGGQDRALPVRGDVFGGPAGPDAFGGQGPVAPGSGGADPSARGGFSGQAQNAFAPGPEGRGGSGRGDERQLPPPGAPRAQLPGGPGNTPPERQERIPLRPSLDAPRGHEEPAAGQFARPGTGRQAPRQDDRQGPGSTAEFARPDFDAPRPGQGAPSGGPVRDQGTAPQGPRGPQRPQGPLSPQDPSSMPSTGQFARQDLDSQRPDYDTRSGYAPQQGPDAGGNAYDTGRQPLQGPAASSPYDTGAHPVAGPGGNAYDTGRHPVPGQNPAYDTGQNPVYDTGRHPVYGEGAPYGGQTSAPAGYDEGPRGGAQDYGRQQGDQQDYRQQDYGRQDYQPQQNPQGGMGQQPQSPSGGRGPQQQDALPPAAGPGDGRTPLYEALETNWFHGANQSGGNGGSDYPSAGRNGQADAPAPGAAPRQDAGYGEQRSFEQRQRPDGARPAMPRRDPGSGLRREPAPADPLFGPVPGRSDASGPAPSAPSPTGPAPNSAWRASPNDELVRQAERVKKPAAGGITTSGLPRRVPRANLVPGTAQEQSTQTGPQVSRAPADVRGRLTNLRRGIQQGRSAGAGGTNGGGFDFGPSHQQERP
ncbi:sensor histidine kinase [Streptomyces sp. 8L]|uniref:sensor histidine kinase n=1 Tax=Streptomyces sp. 8L TaxID=2877242 RepID=UPI001CD73704|nr:nitrate- and nitrite sensing domain-containing protein [Streptomyces sp. 8L]MCA1217947.1 nitrate- and nitrite sensing domain-containing protein [Streptomyces sp. 8L]